MDNERPLHDLYRLLRILHLFMIKLLIPYHLKKASFILIQLHSYILYYLFNLFLVYDIYELYDIDMYIVHFLSFYL